MTNGIPFSKLCGQFESVRPAYDAIHRDGQWRNVRKTRTALCQHQYKAGQTDEECKPATVSWRS